MNIPAYLCACVGRELTAPDCNKSLCNAVLHRTMDVYSFDGII